MFEPASCFSPEVLQESDENAKTSSVIPTDAVRLTKDGRLDEVFLRHVICRIETRDGRQGYRTKLFRELVKKALLLGVTKKTIRRATGASLTYIQGVDAELNAQNKNKQIHEEIRSKARTIPMKHRSGVYTSDFRRFVVECVYKYSHLSVAELANALGTTTAYLQRVKREMPKTRQVSPNDFDEVEREVTPERRLLDRAASTKVEFYDGWHEITCFDDRGSQIGRMIVGLHRAGEMSYVTVIDENGRKTSYISGGERLEFLQKLTGQKL